MRRVWLVAAVVSLAFAACTFGAGEPPFRPSLRWVACPADVEASFVSRHQCGYLTVLQDRSQPHGRTVRLLVVKVWPVGMEPRPGIGTGFGGNVGDPRGLGGGTATGATRLERVVIEMESRGAGPHSEPSLRCPEVDALDKVAAVSRTGDQRLLDEFLAAVRTCRDRLTQTGVDVADYDVSATAVDVEDLRVALGIDRWATVSSEGTASRYVVEYLRRFPDRVDAAFLDSPWFPDVDDLTGGIAGTKAALRQLFTTCAQDTKCDRAHPALADAWQAALHQLAETPLRGPARAGQAGVLVDAGKLLRIARFALGGDGPANLSLVPGIITDAAAGRLSAELARLVADDPLFCAGYRPLCAGQNGFAWGVFLTTFCRDQVPFIDRATVTRQASGDPAYQQVFANSPYLAACDAWQVPAGPPAVHQPVDTQVPLLLLVGQFDSFSPPQVQAAVSRLDHAWAVQVPGQTHNVLGFSDCPIDIRNAWVHQPSAPPAGTQCLHEMGIQFRD